MASIVYSGRTGSELSWKETKAEVDNWFKAVQYEFENKLGIIPSTFSEKFPKSNILTVYQGAFEEMLNAVHSELHMVSIDPPSNMKQTMLDSTTEFEKYFSKFIEAAKESLRKGDTKIVETKGLEALEEAAEAASKAHKALFRYRRELWQKDPGNPHAYLTSVLARQKAMHAET